VITKPGVYDLPNDEYQADPVPGGSLSVSGARKLLPPSCPARYRYERDRGRPPKAAFDFGHAAHKLVLGSGPELVVVDRERWDTNAVKAELAEIRAAGKVPLKKADHEAVTAMAAALREHPFAALLFDADRGPVEQSLFWPDDGTWRRARLDCPTVPLTTAAGFEVFADYKSTDNAAPTRLERSLYDYGYYQQAPWYLDGAIALDLCTPDAAFLFVFQEKTPPYLVTVVQPDAMAMRMGRDANSRALDIYRRCVAEDRWPGYSDDIELVGVPRYVENRFLEEYA
jgi:hypothetical protein